MPDEPKPSFWTTLPGLITGIGGILGAVAAILALVLGGGDDADPDPGGGGGGGGGGVAEITLADWAEEANHVCEDAYGDIRALGIPPDVASQVAAVPQTSRIVTRANQQIQTLDRPADGAGKVDRILELSSRANVVARQLHDAWTKQDAPRYQTLAREYDGLTNELRQLESEVGANVCAEGP
jgi:hypothetical protein